MGKLYAWVNPLQITDKLDHTWVTSYDTRTQTYEELQDVIDAGVNCWLCWGSFHPTGSTDKHPDGNLFETDGDIDLSSCLVTPNAYSEDNDGAKGTIFEYGIDGVCHQLANQVLYGANKDGIAPIVSDAKGYWLSSLMYGDYGRTEDAWHDKINGCTVSSMTKGVSEDDGMPDHLRKHVEEVLGDDSEAIEMILGHRDEQRSVVLNEMAQDDLTIDEINKRNRERLIEMQNKIGRERFVAVFEYAAEDAPDLVDPVIFEASRKQRPMDA